MMLRAGQFGSARSRAALKMEFHGETKVSMIDASTRFILNTTVSGSGVWISPICWKAGWRLEVTPSGGAIMRA